MDNSACPKRHFNNPALRILRDIPMGTIFGGSLTSVQRIVFNVIDTSEKVAFFLGCKWTCWQGGNKAA